MHWRNGAEQRQRTRGATATCRHVDGGRGLVAVVVVRLRSEPDLAARRRRPCRCRRHSWRRAGCSAGRAASDVLGAASDHAGGPDHHAGRRERRAHGARCNAGGRAARRDGDAGCGSRRPSSRSCGAGGDHAGPPGSSPARPGDRAGDLGGCVRSSRHLGWISCGAHDLRAELRRRGVPDDDRHELGRYAGGRGAARTALRPRSRDATRAAGRSGRDDSRRGHHWCVRAVERRHSEGLVERDPCDCSAVALAAPPRLPDDARLDSHGRLRRRCLTPRRSPRCGAPPGSTGIESKAPTQAGPPAAVDSTSFARAAWIARTLVRRAGEWLHRRCPT